MKDREDFRPASPAFPLKELGVSLIVAGGLILAGLITAGAIKFRYTHGDVIAVTGSAEQNFESDLVVWTATFSSKAKNLKDGYKTIKADAASIRQYLTSKGLDAKQIVFSAIATEEIYDEKHNKDGLLVGRDFKGYQLSQSVKVEASDLDKIEAISREITDLIEAGVELASQPPAFYYTKLAELKIGLVGRAAADARLRAETVLKNTGGRLGRLRQSSVGIFQIVGRHSGESYTSSGAYNTSDRAKSAQVTVKVEFMID